MRKSNFALHLRLSLPAELRKAAAAQDAAINQFVVNTAVAEKLSALRTEEYFRERTARGDVQRAIEILDRAGVGTPPLPSHEA
jgi:uncharacterized protein (DUF1778 family)